MIDHMVLATRDLSLEFPIAPLRVVLRSYAGTRYIVYLSAICDQVETRQGIIAGCTYATSLVKAYYFEPVENLIYKWIECNIKVKLDIYLDDFTIEAEGQEQEQVQNNPTHLQAQGPTHLPRNWMR